MLAAWQTTRSSCGKERSDFYTFFTQQAVIYIPSICRHSYSALPDSIGASYGLRLPRFARCPRRDDLGLPAPVRTPGEDQVIEFCVAVGTMTLTLGGMYLALGIQKVHK